MIRSSSSFLLAAALSGLLAAAACSSSGASESGSAAGAAGSAGIGGGAAGSGGGGTGGSLPDAAPEAAGDATPDGAGEAEAAPDAPGEAGIDYILSPAVACAPTGNACPQPAPDSAAFGVMRKDWSLPKSAYNEPVDAPAHGGRLHVAAVASASGDVTQVTVQGMTAQDAIAAKKLEWFHVWPKTTVLGQPVWVAFHSRDAAYDNPTSVHVVVETSGGAAMDATVDATPTPVPLTYVTPSDDFGSFLVHLHNFDTSPHKLAKLHLNGRDVTASACISSKTIAAGRSAMLTVPLCAAASPGDAWTVAVEYEDAPNAVGVGRVHRLAFPIETWNNTSDCPFDYPGADAASYAKHLAAGLDTLFFHGGTGNECASDGNSFKMLTSLAGSTGGMHVLPTDDLMKAPQALLQELTAVEGIFTGDEVDGEVYDGNGVSKPAGEADASTALWARYPGLPTYIGGKTNNNVGTFAGVADIQGMDFYVAACAPHITQWGTHPPLRASFDYLSNARRNHMPLPTWLYAQGLSPAWNKDGALGKVHVQPDPQEILVQALYVPASGAKGMMWFQTNQEEASHKPERWNAIARANWMIRGVRALLREGDATGAASSDADTIVEAIRSREAIVVPVIDIKTVSGPTDVNCAAGALISEASVPHWKLADVAPDVSIEVPEDFGVADVFEVLDTGVVDPGQAPTVQGRTLNLAGLTMNNANPVRLFVLAANASVRAQVQAALAH